MHYAKSTSFFFLKVMPLPWSGESAGSWPATPEHLASQLAPCMARVSQIAKQCMNRP